MSEFKPNTPYNVQAFLMMPTYGTIKGVKQKVFSDEKEEFFCSFRTFGGTEKTSNDLVVVENTAIVETWYRPDIKANCRIVIGEEEYDILGTPENINHNNQYLQFKVRAVEGGV